MRPILICILILTSSSAWAHCAHRHRCNHEAYSFPESRRWTYQEDSDGAWRYYEGQGGGWGDSFYGENGGTAHYGD